MAFINLANPQGPGERQTVRRTAHFRRRRDDKHITNFAQRPLENLQPFGVNAVIVCDKYSRHLVYQQPPFTRGPSLKRKLFRLIQLS